MSRAYLFSLAGEQLDVAHWYGDLITGRGRTTMAPPQAYIIAIRGRKGYRVRKTPALPNGSTTIAQHISETRMHWLGARTGERYLPTIHAVRAYLQLGGEID